MKICNCRDFNDAALREAILKNTPERPEQTHEIIRNAPPQCGACLPFIQAAMDRHAKTGIVPGASELTLEELETARQKLRDRFAAEPDAGSEQRPCFKRRFTPVSPPAKPG